MNDQELQKSKDTPLPSDELSYIENLRKNQHVWRLLMQERAKASKLRHKPPSV